MANQKFDVATIDLQHGLIDYQMAVTMMQAMSYTDVTPFVRVPWNDPGTIMKVLDAGACGVICPMINTAAQAQSLVAACKYPPQGTRSWGPIRASLWAGPDYGGGANSEIAVLPMIETAEALGNLDEILAVPGIDGVYVGPADLGLSLGRSAVIDQTDPVVAEAQERIVKACQRHGVVAGIHTASPAYAAKMIAAGYRFISLGSDSRFLATMAASALGQLREGAGASVAY
jgi:4-hydroxy-2-oxoheptanedioate aldolase